MAEKTTYIRLDRNIARWKWYSDANTFRVFIHLLLNARYTDGEYQGIYLEKGQGVFTRKDLEKELGLSEQNVKTALGHLKKDRIVTISRSQKKSLYTVLNYGYYQGYQPQKQPDANHKVTKTDKRRTNKEKEAKRKKEEENIIYKAGEEGGMGGTKELSFVKTLFNTICTGFAKIIVLTKERREAISNLLASYTLEEIKQAFQNAENSDFLKGKKGKWKATFDWMINEDNFAKLLEGNYNDDGEESFDSDEFFQAAVNKSYGVFYGS